MTPWARPAPWRAEAAAGCWRDFVFPAVLAILGLLLIQTLRPRRIPELFGLSGCVFHRNVTPGAANPTCGAAGDAPEGSGEVHIFSTEPTTLPFCGGKMLIPVSIQRTGVAPSQGGFSPGSSPLIHEEQARPPGQAPRGKGGSSPSHSQDLLQAHRPGHSHSLGKTRWESPSLESFGKLSRDTRTDPKATTAPLRSPLLPTSPTRGTSPAPRGFPGHLPPPRSHPNPGFHFFFTQG